MVNPTNVNSSKYSPVKQHIYIRVVQNYGAPKLPLRRPFANLWRPFAPEQSEQGIMIMFPCANFVIKIYRRIVLKTRKWRFTDCPPTETQVEKTLKGFAVATLQDKLDHLDHFGPVFDPGTLAFRLIYLIYPSIPVKNRKTQVEQTNKSIQRPQKLKKTV